MLFAIQVFVEEAFYAYTYERPTSPWLYLWASLATLGVLLACMFPLAPAPIKLAVFYVCATLVVAILAVLSLRSFVGAVSWILSGSTLWLLPNLLSEVGRRAGGRARWGLTGAFTGWLAAGSRVAPNRGATVGCGSLPAAPRPACMCPGLRAGSAALPPPTHLPPPPPALPPASSLQEVPITELFRPLISVQAPSKENKWGSHPLVRLGTAGVLAAVFWVLYAHSPDKATVARTVLHSRDGEGGVGACLGATQGRRWGGQGRAWGQGRAARAWCLFIGCARLQQLGGWEGRAAALPGQEGTVNLPDASSPPSLPGQSRGLCCCRSWAGGQAQPAGCTAPATASELVLDLAAAELFDWLKINPDVKLLANASHSAANETAEAAATEAAAAAAEAAAETPPPPAGEGDSAEL